MPCPLLSSQRIEEPVHKEQVQGLTCVLMANVTGEQWAVKLLHCLPLPGEQPSCLSTYGHEVEFKVWEGKLGVLRERNGHGNSKGLSV